ncbi:hypothetical protein ABMA28_000654 [Loxostege sticticalis]|uniref:Reverse transcriptase domain-containing protein n=1 Tax=Loxostege sticticalis TaxID=481309 RepID=A0ABD0T332_LOXSC
MALGCFKQLERRLESNPITKQSYHEFIHEYIRLGHMTEVPSVRDAKEREISFYAPHHGVTREDSSTTKLRVVFNCSAKTSNGISFNDIQLVGPRVQDDLFDILIRFRFYKIVLIADIEKMYRQIIVDTEQRKLQKILFRDTKSEPVKVYELNTVTYGTSSAPYAATRCIKQLSLDCQDPIIADVLGHDFYIDDLVSGGDSPDEVVHIGKNLKDLLASAGFHLRKWRSNDQTVLSEIVDQNCTATNNFEISDNELSKTLGLGWNHSSDELFFILSQHDTDKPITKRSMLSQIGRIFDPLGLLAIYTIEAKILIQELWLLKLEWDSPVPDDIHQLWLKFIQSITELSIINVPRRVLCDSPLRSSLHIFCDASQKAYGACAYTRTVNRDGIIEVRLLCAKSRVAPLKRLTMPKLELCGALIASRLYQKIHSGSRKPIVSVSF